MHITFSLDYVGDLADSLRAVANLVEEYGDAFFKDPTSYYAIHNAGSVHRIAATDPSDSSPCTMAMDEIIALVGGNEDDDCCDDAEYFEECPECGHREESDGYGGNDCPECNEAMKVLVCYPGWNTLES
jgi:hypothetical protein